MAAVTLIWPGKINGQIDIKYMREVAPGKYMQPDAAIAFKAMQKALLAATGVTLYIEDVQDAYRSLDEQKRLYAAHQADPTGTPSAAWPGTSNHGFGLAVDCAPMGLAIVRTWMGEHADEYGYRVYRITSEPWHIEYIGPITNLAGDGERIEEEIMADNWVDTSTYVSGKAAKGTQCLTTWEGGVSLPYARTLVKGETANIMFDKYGPHKEVPHELFEAIKAAFEKPAGTVTNVTAEIDPAVIEAGVTAALQKLQLKVS